MTEDIRKDVMAMDDNITDLYVILRLGMLLAIAVTPVLSYLSVLLCVLRLVC